MQYINSQIISSVKVFVILILLVMTVLLSNVIDRYEISGGELLLNNNFEKKFEFWRKTGDGIALLNEVQPVLQLKSSGNQKKVSVRQTLKDINKGQPVRLVGAIKTDDVSKGDKVWMAARVIFVAKDNDGRSMFNLPHKLVTHNGSKDWETFSKDFITIADASSYYVEVQLLNVTGNMLVKNLSLKYLKETFAYNLFLIISMLLWLAVTLWILLPQRHTIISSSQNVLIMLLMLIALIGVLMPTGVKHDILNAIVLFFPWAGGEIVFFRMGHFLVFCILSVAVFNKIHSSRQILTRFGLLLVFAMATEIIQFLVDGRTPKISDFFVDVSGIFLGFFMSRMILLYMNRGNSQVTL